MTITITGLPSQGTVLDTTLIPVETASVTGRITALSLRNYISSGTLTSVTATSAAFTSATISSLSTSSMTVTGDASVTGNLTASGNLLVANIWPISPGNISVKGNINFGNITVANNVTAGNLLTNSGLFWAGNGVNVLSAFLATSSLYANANVSAYLPGYTGNVQASYVVPQFANTTSLGSSVLWWNNVYGTTFTGTSITAQYADLAEKYTSDADYEPGTVVVFGDATEVTISQQYQDNRVAGVVTTKPAYLMNSDLESSVAVTLQGRVPCRVVGTVRRGDMMVTSDVPGVATACAAPSIGTVIGKALENYNNSDVGVIEVVVGRV